jgi:hypothetical protein
MRFKYNAEKLYIPVDVYVGNNELEVVSVDDHYVAIGNKAFTDNLEEAVIMHPEYASKLRADMIIKYQGAEVYTWRYVDLIRYKKSELIAFKRYSHVKIKIK